MSPEVKNVRVIIVDERGFLPSSSLKVIEKYILKELRGKRNWHEELTIGFSSFTQLPPVYTERDRAIGTQKKANLELQS